jgi:nucleotide-binding universal stress UspA family protein
MSGMVLCGVNWHEESRLAVRAARELSHRLGARLVLAHVAPTPVMPGVSVVAGDQEEVAFQEQLDAEELFAEVLADEGLPEAVERRIAFGDPAHRLAALAADEGADYLVVSSRGRRRFRSFVLGRVCSELATTAPCPVVVVPPSG